MQPQESLEESRDKFNNARVKEDVLVWHGAKKKVSDNL
jgi:hypothetical protein